jgi:hypothetical protein
MGFEDLGSKRLELPLSGAKTSSLSVSLPQKPSTDWNLIREEFERFRKNPEEMKELLVASFQRQEKLKLSQLVFPGSKAKA